MNGAGNFMEFSERGYDSRVGRFQRVDPIAIEYPWNSPYAFAENRVIDGIDLEGLEYLNAAFARIEMVNGIVKIKTANQSYYIRSRINSINNNSKL